MDRKLVSASALLSMLVLCSILSAPSAAADYSKVGVMQGDTANYAVTGPDMPEGTTAHLYVKSATGTLVGINFTVFNPGGSVNNTQEFVADVSTGSGFPGVNLLIPSGLKQGDHLYQSLSTPVINSTVQMSIAGYTRTVNLLNLTSGPAFLRMSWDQASGLLVEVSTNQGGSLAEILLTSTTAFGILSDLVVMLLIGGGIAAVVVIAVAAIILHRRRK